MPMIPLVAGPYQSRSLIAGAQRSVNLYPEFAPQNSQAPVPVTHFPTPGLRKLVDGPIIGRWRQLYTATNGELYGVLGENVYYISPSWILTLLGTIAIGPNPVYFADNHTTIVLVDGTSNGYQIDMATRIMSPIVDPYFYGAVRVTYLDTYFVYDRPNTNQFYIGPSNAVTPFDPLDVAAKTGSPDNIATLVSMHRELWLIGTLTSEVWTNTGAADFTFGPLPGVFIEHGTIAPYSLAVQDNVAFWLMRDRQGRGIVVQSQNYNVARLSTYAIEAAIQSYGKIDDAIGNCYQIDGHIFYVLTFPSADVTWAVEVSTGQWHELSSTDDDGNLNRHRANCYASAYGIVVAGDYQNGKLYAVDPNYYLDDETPIIRLRSWPHLRDDGNRVSYTRFQADIEVGTLPGTSDADGTAPQCTLRWSDDRGATFGNGVMQSLGAYGEFLTSPNWQRLGIARDRVFELSWSAPMKIALNGAWIDATPLAT